MQTTLQSSLDGAQKFLHYDIKMIIFPPNKTEEPYFPISHIVLDKGIKKVKWLTVIVCVAHFTIMSESEKYLPINQTLYQIKIFTLKNLYQSISK